MVRVQMSDYERAVQRHIQMFIRDSMARKPFEWYPIIGSQIQFDSYLRPFVNAADALQVILAVTAATNHGRSPVNYRVTADMKFT